MLQAVHQASQSVKETVGGDCPVFQRACPFKNCMTSSGTPLVQELETRTWGLMIRGDAGADAEGTSAGAEEAAEVAAAPEAEAATRLEADVEGLAGKLKQGTKEAHKAAETVHFVHEFIKGRVPREIYAQFVVNLYHVYLALEEALDACADHPLVEPLYFPEELRRAPALKKDAEYFNGPDWEEKMSPSQVTMEYVERMRQVARESPELIVPHAYTRYLGDLSGGQVLRRAAVRGLKLPDDGSGVCFYTFRRIRDAKVFKNMYRARLDSLPANSATADAMVVEANSAFNYNTRIFQELDALGGFVAEETPLLLTAPSGPPATATTTGAAAAAGAAAACPFAALAASGVPMPADHPPMVAPVKREAAEAATPQADRRPGLPLDRCAAVAALVVGLAALLLSPLAALTTEG